MRPEDPRVHLTRDWFDHARRDLASSERLLAQPALPAEAAFHVQQAIEKALKGWLAWQNVPFAKTHDLVELLDQCAAIDPGVLVFRLQLAPLTRHGVETRYPGDDPEPDVEGVETALDLARRIVTFVRARVPSSVWPSS